MAAALEAEVNAYIAELADQRDESGRRLVVRNGFHRPRKVTTAAGAIEVKAPRVNDGRVDQFTGERRRFSSAILPPWARKSPKISEVLPLLYLHGLSSGDFVPALEQLLGRPLTRHGHSADRAVAGRSPGIRRARPVGHRLRLRVGRIHLRIRLSEAKSCVLVVTGVRADGAKELIAMADGDRGVRRVLGRPCACRKTHPSWWGLVYGWCRARALGRVLWAPGECPGRMICRAASTCPSGCGERVRPAAAAAGEQPGQGRGDPRAASSDHRAGTPARPGSGAVRPE
ncbi:transposase [Streptomyces hyaluromycini]|uniref:transposase n=1 Tax=Streptomyces hyaluromycini TaxID=1377993 RepID=UPI0034CE71B3